MRNLIKPFCLVLPSMFLYTASAPASEQPYQSHAEILDAARQHLLDQSAGSTGRQTIKLTPLDHRIKLSRCREALETFTPLNSDNRGKVTVGVKCSAPTPWKIYVTGNVEVEGPVVVANRDLKRGSVIGLDDVKLITRDTNHLLRGHFESLAQVVGSTLRRDLHREQVITPGQLLVRKTISRGQLVTILAGDSGIEVRMQGKALRNGNPGDLIPVRNLSSKKKLEARVVAAGEVRIE